MEGVWKNQGMRPKYRIGLVQMSCGVDPRENVEQAVARIRDAAKRGAQIICLQELFRSQYFCREEDPARFELAEPIPGPTSEIIGKIALETGTVVVASLFERRAAGVYHNTAAVLDADGSLLGIYRKMHIPEDPLYYEKFYFAPGDLGFRTFETAFGRIGVLVCWDQWYPEAARLTAMQGAEILVYPTAIGWHPAEKHTHGEHQHAAWETMQRSHAIANGCFVVAVNRVGFEPDPSSSAKPQAGIEFWGQSFIVAPDGRVVVRAPVDHEAVIVQEIDLAEIDASRIGWPFFRDRRIDAYAEITKRFGDGG